MATMLDLMERELGVDAQARARARERRGRPARDAGREPGRRACTRSSATARSGRNPRVAYEFKLPDLGEGLTEGEIARWLVQRGPGDRRGRPARRDRDRQDDGRDPLAGGRRRLADPRRGGRGRPGRHGPRRHRRERRARRRSRKPVPGTARGAVAPAGGKVRATPLVRRLAEELGVDLATVTGTGPQGRITEADVRGAGAAPAARRSGASRSAASSGRCSST